MIARFDTALAAAQAATSAQSHPQACLYVVATPIGNLADISLRALHLLHLADTLACEDTRHSQSLLRAYGIAKPASAWLAVHQHNEAQAAQEVIVRLQQGQRVAYISDAGTPGVSDPGARLVAAVQAAGLRASPIPGASSVTALLSVSACTDDSGFVFAGFLPSKATERQQAIQAMAADARAQVLLEAPHRIEALAKDLAVLGERPITLGRELTKQFEQVQQLAAQDLATWLARDPSHAKGEFVLVLHALAQAPTGLGEAERILDVLLPELPLKTAVRLAAQISGAPRNALYELALHKREADED